MNEPTMESQGYHAVDLPLWRASKIERAFGWSREPDFYYEHGSVFEGPNHYYVQHTWIGCAGFLVDKVTFELLRFGSYIDPELHIWAFHEGISLHKTNTLTLTQIHDDKAAIDLLARLYRRSEGVVGKRGSFEWVRHEARGRQKAA